VRSVILDGVVPQDENLGSSVASDAERALNLIFDRCAAEASCGIAYPNIRAEFTQLLTKLDQQPIQVTVAQPSSGEDVQLALTADKVASALRLLSYSAESASLIPLMIHKAQSEGDYGLLASQYLMVTGELSDSISAGMNYSVICSEDVPFLTPSSLPPANSDVFIKSLKTEDLITICKSWPKGSIPSDFKNPVQSDRPVLILSGEADPVTPPENGKQAAKTLPNSLNLVAPGQGHNVIYRGCIPRIAFNFIETGDVKALDTACVQDIRAMPFFVNLSGPIP
jgi:pimeloyl-ACP methyl ester carboxylesterase